MAQGFKLPPGLDGYVAAEQLGQQRTAGQLGQLSTMLQLHGALQKQRREEAYRGVLSSVPADATQEDVIKAIRPFASAGDLLRTQQSSLDRKAVIDSANINRQTAREQKLSEIELLGKQEIKRIREQAVQNRITKEEADVRERSTREFLLRAAASLRPPQQPRQPPRPVEMRDSITGEIKLYDAVTRQPWLPSGSQDAAQAPSPSAPLEPRGAISPAIDAPLGTGPSGAFGNAANTFGGLFGYQPFPDVEKAVQAIRNLQVRTTTGLQDAVPGRPSNFLMQKLGELTVNPASFTMGDARAADTMRQMKETLRTEVDRMNTDVLAKPGLYTPTEVSKTRISKSKLETIIKDYDTMIRSFEGGTKKPGASGGWSIRPIP